MLILGPDLSTFLACLLVTFLHLGLHASDDLQKSYSAIPLKSPPPDIDGVLDDAAWSTGKWEEGFVQREPYEGVDPTQKTAFKILYDNENIYVAIRAYDSEPGKIEKRLSRRDAFEGDWVAIAFDSYFDKLTAFSFGVSASGVKNDLFVSNEDQMDDTWDPVWYVKTSVDHEGWTAEMKIPLTQVRFAKTKNHVWGVQVMRWLFRKEEFSTWQPIPQESSRWVSRFGELTGIEGISPKREVELIPYVMGNLETMEKEDGNPYCDGTSLGYSAGLDGKVAVTNDLTLNFTVNPDFGQVEADPSEVNLTAFETFFPEKRPFFIEGSNIYNFQVTAGDGPNSQDNLFYSRRIGNRPSKEPELDDDEYMDKSEFTRILGAFKLSGKTRNGWSIGVMESVTNKEKAAISCEGVEHYKTIEPLTNFFNGRVQKDFGKGKTVLGGMVTATNRMIEDTSINFLAKSAYTGGVDFQNFWKDKNYYLGIRTLFSQVSGSKESITNVQESSRRYYQRPDAEHLQLDTTLSSLTGHGGTIEGGKIGGGHWRYLGWLTWRSPGLELNDMGYLRQADLIQQVLWVQYRVWEPVAIFRNFSINLNQWSEHDFSGTRLTFAGNMNFNLQFKNYWSMGSGIEVGTTTIKRAELRGGPALAYPGDVNNWIALKSDSRKKLTVELFMFNNWGAKNSSRFLNAGLEFTYRPVNSLSFSLGPEYIKGKREMQYVETIELATDNRFIISTLETDQWSANIRANLNITPDLTIQYWGQPFLFAGNYSVFKRVTEPLASHYEDRFHVYTGDEIFYDETNGIYHFDENLDGETDYSLEDPNFNFFEFRSNLVLRWEYIPGSTVYLVWSQGRTGDNNAGEFSFKNDLNSLYSIAPHNVFLIKFSYRISI